MFIYLKKSLVYALQHDGWATEQEDCCQASMSVWPESTCSATQQKESQDQLQKCEGVYWKNEAKQSWKIWGIQRKYEKCRLYQQNMSEEQRSRACEQAKIRMQNYRQWQNSMEQQVMELKQEHRFQNSKKSGEHRNKDRQGESPKAHNYEQNKKRQI